MPPSINYRSKLVAIRGPKYLCKNILFFTRQIRMVKGTAVRIVKWLDRDGPVNNTGDFRIYRR